MPRDVLHNEKLVKSRQRVTDHGEVFTPGWLVQDILDLVKPETERIDARFLEPACGSGNFLIPILERKLAVVRTRYRRSDFERRHYGLLALMCVYGIELLADNAAECRSRLLITFSTLLGLEGDDVWLRGAERVLALNIIEGDATNMTASDGAHIIFSEWGYLGRGKFQRRDFRYDAISQRAHRNSLDDNGNQEVFVPIATFPPMTVQELAA